VFARGKDGIKFYEHQGFCQESMFDVMEMIYLRLVDLFIERGYVMANGEASSPEDEEDLSVPQPFIPRAPKADFQLVTHFSETSGYYFQKEKEHLLSKGYTPSADGFSLIPPK
jgi:hypothetical protein